VGKQQRNMPTEWDECEVGILNIASLLFEFLLSLSNGFSLPLAEVWWNASQYEVN